MRYRTVSDERKVGTQILRAIRVEWDGQVDATAQDAVDPASTQELAKTVEFGAIIGDFLQDGPKPASACNQRLREAGWEGNGVTSESAIKKRAKAMSTRIDGQWHWTLIPEATVGNHK